MSPGPGRALDREVHRQVVRHPPRQRHEQGTCQERDPTDALALAALAQVCLDDGDGDGYRRAARTVAALGEADAGDVTLGACAGRGGLAGRVA